jgi:hypothetical protein
LIFKTVLKNTQRKRLSKPTSLISVGSHTRAPQVRFKFRFMLAIYFRWSDEETPVSKKVGKKSIATFS